MEKLGVDAQFQGTSGIKSDAFLSTLGPLSEGALSFQEGAPVDKLPGGKYFTEQYEKAGFERGHEAYGPFSFAAMTLILDTIEDVGPNRKKVRKSLNKVNGYESIVGEISFDDHGQNTVAAITKYVGQDGKWVVWEDSAYGKGDRKLKKQ